jgi:hypothetical protein
MQINLSGLIACGRGELLPADLICCSSISDAQQLVNIMKNILLATVAIVAFSAPSFAQAPKTTGQSPPSFYLAQDTATMKCQIVETQPVAGGTMKVVGAPHSTKASAEAALKADKTCK